MGLFFKLNWAHMLLNLEFKATLLTLIILPSLNYGWVLVCVQLN